MKNILITGGAGFIGSAVVRDFVKRYPQAQFVTLDLLTYAGNPQNLGEASAAGNHQLVVGDICDFENNLKLFKTYDFDTVVHLAAESHVDRSIKDPFAFAQTNVMGTLSLLEAAKRHWNGDFEGKKFYHISTDEVYGTLGDSGLFTEQTPYDPHSPYSASKASSDHFVRAYHDTYGLPVVLSNCSNNYGPYQYPEKLIPVCIQKIVQQQPIPVYGQGINVRDWLYVEDHVAAIATILEQGKLGETYNIGGHNEWKNIDLIRVIIKHTDQLLGRSQGSSLELISFVEDRLGHDLRYAIDASKIEKELGWTPEHNFDQGIQKTVGWYLENLAWIDSLK